MNPHLLSKRLRIYLTIINDIILHVINKLSKIHSKVKVFFLNNVCIQKSDSFEIQIKNFVTERKKSKRNSNWYFVEK